MAPTSFRVKTKVLAVAHKGSGSDHDISLPFPPPTVSHNHATPAAYLLHLALSFRRSSLSGLLYVLFPSAQVGAVTYPLYR